MTWRPTKYPAAPEEMKRLSWFTDQMRRRSEEDQVRVGDWASFAQFVKKHYLKYGLDARPFRGTVGRDLSSTRLWRPAKQWPRWITDIVASERQVPGVNCRVSFEEALRLSGAHVADALPAPAQVLRAESKIRKGEGGGRCAAHIPLHCREEKRSPSERQGRHRAETRTVPQRQRGCRCQARWRIWRQANSMPKPTLEDAQT